MSSGRKTMCTPEVIKALKTAREIGASIKDCCLFAGIDPAQYYKWMNRGELGEEPYRDFRDTLLRAKGRGIVALLANVKTAAKSGDWRAAAWMLSMMNPDDYSVGKSKGDADKGVTHLNTQDDLQDALRELDLEQLKRIRSEFVSADDGTDDRPSSEGDETRLH